MRSPHCLDHATASARARRQALAGIPRLFTENDTGDTRSAVEPWRVYCSFNYPSQGKVAGKPAGIFASAGGPTDVIIGVLEQALKWFKLKAVAEPVGSSGGVSASALSACRELGKKLAEEAAAAK